MCTRSYKELGSRLAFVCVKHTGFEILVAVGDHEESEL